jgi:hypothetical protein
MHSKFKQQLIKLEACQPAIDWVGERTFEQAYNDCERGDWLLWLYASTADLTIDANHRLLTLAKAKCANTVRHLMKDERSTKAVDIAIAYGEGRATREELAADAAGAAAAAYAAADYDAAYAAYAAAYADYAADYAAAYAAAAMKAYAAMKENQKLTADIVRSIITIDKFSFYAQ